MDYERSTRAATAADEAVVFQDKRPVRMPWSGIFSALGLFAGSGALNLGKARVVTGTGNATAATDPTLIISGDSAATAITLPTAGMVDGDSRVYFNDNSAGGFTVNGAFLGGLGTSIPIARGNVLWVFYSAVRGGWGVL